MVRTHPRGYLPSRAYGLSAATLIQRVACLKAHAPAEFARASRVAYGA